jgi:hypothetical protein
MSIRADLLELLYLNNKVIDSAAFSGSDGGEYTHFLRSDHEPLHLKQFLEQLNLADHVYLNLVVWLRGGGWITAYKCDELVLHLEPVKPLKCAPLVSMRELGV